MIFSLLFAIAQTTTVPTSETRQLVLDKQASITIPSNWKSKSYPMPVRGSVNFRITSESLRMAITSIPESEEQIESDLPPGLAAKLKEIPEEKKITYEVLRASTQYMLLGGKQYAKEESPTFKGEGYLGAILTFSSPNQTPMFPVFNDKKYQCVTTSIIKAEKVSYVISVGSEDCSGFEHSSAIAAIKSLVIAGG